MSSQMVLKQYNHEVVLVIGFRTMSSQMVLKQLNSWKIILNFIQL